MIDRIRDTSFRSDIFKAKKTFRMTSVVLSAGQLSQFARTHKKALTICNRKRNGLQVEMVKDSQIYYELNNVVK